MFRPYVWEDFDCSCPRRGDFVRPGFCAPHRHRCAPCRTARGSRTGSVQRIPWRRWWAGAGKKFVARIRAEACRWTNSGEGP